MVLVRVRLGAFGCASLCAGDRADWLLTPKSLNGRLKAVAAVGWMGGYKGPSGQFLGSGARWWDRKRRKNSGQIPTVVRQ